MEIIELKERKDILEDVKLNRIYIQVGALLKELKQQQLPDTIIQLINQDVEEINTTSFSANQLLKLLKKKQAQIIKVVEKELKIVPKNYYRNLWLVAGMSAFGLPIGVAFGVSMGNIGLLGIGLPIGMGIGSIVGARMDKKALDEGRQLDVEIKY